MVLKNPRKLYDRSFEDSNLLNRKTTRTFNGKISSTDNKHFIGKEVIYVYIYIYI